MLAFSILFMSIFCCLKSNPWTQDYVYPVPVECIKFAIFGKILKKLFGWVKNTYSKHGFARAKNTYSRNTQKSSRGLSERVQYRHTGKILF